METVLEFAPVRALAAFALLCRAFVNERRGRAFPSLDDFCRVVRLSESGWMNRIALERVFSSVEAARSTSANPVIATYLADPASARLAAIFTIRGGKQDLWRDLVVLKRATDTEKGVILLKYARTFSAVVALFDMKRLTERYTFVLEPCWAGYCDPSILMHLTPGNPVVVQCFTERDYQYIAQIGAPLVPIRQGPADWVDADVFREPPDENKKYDLVMVANWAARKRHALLFRALRDIRDRDIRVLLIGFAWFNRTADDIRREAAENHNPRVTIEIVEKVPHTTLARYLRQCKVFVFLSRKEGDNKALVEAMFADVPAIVYDRTIGGASSRVNKFTGMFSSEAKLTESVLYMLDNYRRYSPRAWALEHTGSEVSTRILNEALRQAVTQAGGKYTTGIVEKTNAPNLAYKNPQIRAEFAADYEFILSCQRSSSRS
jgi:glycosyltransferase involved in cell wall biosynthesis